MVGRRTQLPPIVGLMVPSVFILCQKDFNLQMKRYLLEAAPPYVLLSSRP